MIELNQLEQLIYIAENKTISKAAKELLISQPALSRSMQRLESDLGVELFDHYKNKIVLNKNGELAVKHAQKIIKSIQTMINDVQDYDQSFHRISIATCSPAPMWDIEPLIKELYPQITIQTAVINQKDLITKLKEKEYQLIITPEQVDDSQYVCIPYVEEDLLLSLPLNHPLTKKKTIKFHDLDGQTMLLYSNIGFWHDLHMQKTPKTKYLLQEERFTFNEIVKASTLPSYTSNLSIKREGKMSDRIILPIDEEEAHVTYYVVMLKENNGQISVEYLFIFAIALILLTVFTLPLANLAIEKTTDISDAINVKSQLYKIADGINQVYGEGQGAKQSVNLELDQNINVNIYKKHLSAGVKFNDHSSKLIKVNHDADVISGILNLNKGKNTIVIEWPAESENIFISKK